MQTPYSYARFTVSVAHLTEEQAEELFGAIHNLIDEAMGGEQDEHISAYIFNEKDEAIY